MVNSLAKRQGPGFPWVKWSEIGWPRLVDIPPERQTTWFARTTAIVPPVVVPATTPKSPSQGDGAADGGDDQKETVPATALPEEGNPPASLAGVDAAPPATEPDSAAEGALEARVAETSPSLAEVPASLDDAELPRDGQEDPGYAGDGGKTQEHAPSVQEEIPPPQTEDRVPSPAALADPKEDDAKSVSSTSSEHSLQPPSDVAKGKRKCVEFASSAEDIPFNSSHQRSFPLVRNKSLTSLLTRTPERTKTPAIMGYEEVEPSGPSRSVLEAIGLRDSDWDDSVLAPGLQLTFSPELIGAVPEPVADKSEPVADEPEPVANEPEPVANEPEPVTNEPEPVAKEPEPVANEPEPVANEPVHAANGPEPVANEPVPVANEPEPVVILPEPSVVPPEPSSDVTDHVHDLPNPVGTLPEPVGTLPTMSGALPVPAGWQPEPIDNPKSAEVPKIRWTSLLLRKLRNAALPMPILQLLLGREVAEQVKAALELHASGAA